MAARKHADYEYPVEGQKLRVERYSNGWRWLVFWTDGDIETQSDQGDYSRLKSDAIKDGIRWIKKTKDKHKA